MGRGHQARQLSSHGYVVIQRIRPRVSSSELIKDTAVNIPVNCPIHVKNLSDPRICEGRLFYQPRIYFVAEPPPFQREMSVFTKSSTSSPLECPQTPSDFNKTPKPRASWMDHRITDMPSFNKFSDPRSKLSSALSSRPNDPRLRKKYSPNGGGSFDGSDLQIPEQKEKKESFVPLYPPLCLHVPIRRPLT